MTSENAYRGTSRACRSCGAAITLIEGPAGKYIPVQKVTLIYAVPVGLPGMDQGDPKLEVVHTGEFYVSHFQTCPQAAEHSRRGG